MVIDEFPTESPGKCIMIWHAIQGGKKIGLDQPNPYYSRYHTHLMSRIVTGGTGTVQMWAGCTGVPEDRILPLGLPRTDAYIGKRKGDGRTILAGKKRSYLYAPTFRGGGEPPFPDIDWDWLDDELTDDELLVVKAHTVTDRILTKASFRRIVEVSHDEPSAPYLYDCDVVITDYSSIMFDGYLLGKPAVLFEKTGGYTETRGMYLDYPGRYSSRYCTNERDLLDMIRGADGLNATEAECLRLVADSCDGHASERLCELIHSTEEG